MYGNCETGYCDRSGSRYSGRSGLISIYQSNVASAYLSPRGSDTLLAPIPHENNFSLLV